MIAGLSELVLWNYPGSLRKYPQQDFGAEAEVDRVPTGVLQAVRTATEVLPRYFTASCITILASK